MTNKRKTGWLLVFLLVIHYVVVPATAQQSVNTPNAEELLFQQAIGDRIFIGLDPTGLDPLSLERIDALLSSKKISADVSGSALAHAAGSGDVELVKLLISKGANVNYKVEEKGRTVLMLATERGFQVPCGNDPMVTNYPGNSKVVKFLLEAGARVDDQDDEGNTALMLAAGKGRSDSVKLLLEARANVRLGNVYGWTALIYAANSSGHFSETNLKAIVQGLLSNSDVNVGDLQGKTALDYAERSQAIREVLISAGAIKRL